MTEYRKLKHQMFGSVPDPVYDVLQQMPNVSVDDAKAIVKHLFDAGYVITPLEPVMASYVAYIKAYGMEASNPSTILRNVAKARARYKMMVGAGYSFALSKRRVEVVIAPDITMLADDLNTAGNTLGQKGGHARAAKLTPERRSEIASKAAKVRWAKSRSSEDDDIGTD